MTNRYEVLERQGFPYSANYAATKAYLLSLGEALHYELKATGVIVTVLSPGPTDTPMSKAIASAHDLDASKMPIESMDVGTGRRRRAKGIATRASLGRSGLAQQSDRDARRLESALALLT